MPSIFDEAVERMGTDSCKWNGKESELPMWVADMDFRSPQPVIDALEKRVRHGVYGYAMPKEEWAKAYQDFYLHLYGWDFKAESLHFVSSIVAAVYAAIEAYTEVGDEKRAEPWMNKEAKGRPHKRVGGVAKQRPLAITYGTVSGNFAIDLIIRRFSSARTRFGLPRKPATRRKRSAKPKA
ncbi:MAG: hypothetical protein K6F32_07470 [Bacilli bacterium]|nr:hypothetical protein [Bacilli bacterium]